MMVSPTLKVLVLVGRQISSQASNSIDVTRSNPEIGGPPQHAVNHSHVLSIQANEKAMKFFFKVAAKRILSIYKDPLYGIQGLSDSVSKWG